MTSCRPNCCCFVIWKATRKTPRKTIKIITESHFIYISLLAALRMATEEDRKKNQKCRRSQNHQQFWDESTPLIISFLI